MTAYIESIKTGLSWQAGYLKTSFRTLCTLALVVKLVICAALALAATPTFSPTRLGAFCPQGSEIANAQQTKLLTLQEQAQIKKNVQGFMSLDAGARRSFGHPLGAAIYWEKGYTAKFDDVKEVPTDWVRYIAYRLSNICVAKEGVLVVIVLDIADMAGRQVDMKLKTGSAFLSSQLYWDAFSRTEISLPDKESSPEQPVLFTTIPLRKDVTGHWVVEAKKVPILKKINKVNWRAEIEKRDKAYKCIESPEKFRSTCDFNEKEKLMLTKYSRPAWSVYPEKRALGVTDVKPANR